MLPVFIVDLAELVAYIVCIWICIIFLDTIFKTCMVFPYYNALERAGLCIKPFVVTWQTTQLNRFLNQVGHWKPVLFRHWFNAGAVFSGFIIIPCLILHSKILIDMCTTTNFQEMRSAKILPVVPGYNFPISHWKMYILVMLICSLFHEFGHAISASREGVTVENCGVTVCAIVPIAFVRLQYAQFLILSKWQQLRILCAGIWHNIILSLWAYLLLASLSVILSPFYYVGSGVSVHLIHEQSGLRNPGGFHVGDKIYEISNCAIHNYDTWITCIEEVKNKSYGLCIPETLLENDNSAEECTDSSSLYFQTKASMKTAKGICMHARTAVTNFKLCENTSQCAEPSLCMLPNLQDTHKLLIIKRFELPVVLYEGTIDELKEDVEVSDYLPRFMVLSPCIAEFIRHFLAYIAVFSSGLAALNVLPIFSFDGQFIFQNFLHIGFTNQFNSTQLQFVARFFSNLAGLMFILFGLLTVLKFIKQYNVITYRDIFYPFA